MYHNKNYESDHRIYADQDELRSLSQNSQDDGIIHPNFIPELELVDLKAIKMLMSPKTKQEAEMLDRVSQ